MKQELGVEFTKLKRTHALLTMLQWPGPDQKYTSYMPLSEFRKRKVLPSPFGVWSKKNKR
jgi:hypothetical protein